MHLLVRALVGAPRLDPVPVEVGGGIGLGHVEVAARARAAGADHGGEDREGPVHRPGVDADARVLGHVGEAVLVGGDRHLARPGVVGDAVARHVLVRAGGPVPRDGAEDDARVHLAQALVGEAPSGQGPGPHRLDHDVGLLDEVQVDLHALGLAQVDRDRALAPVDVKG